MALSQKIIFHLFVWMLALAFSFDGFSNTNLSFFVLFLLLFSNVEELDVGTILFSKGFKLSLLLIFFSSLGLA